MVSTGLAAAGFKFVNLDAGVWLPNRSAAGQLQPDPSKFPSGLHALAARLHQSGLTLGLYTDLSSRAVGKVCGTGPGSFGHFDDDAEAIVGYGAGFVKVDYCACKSLDAFFSISFFLSRFIRNPIKTASR